MTNHLPHANEFAVFLELTDDGTPYQLFTAGINGDNVRVYDVEYSRREQCFYVSRCGSSLGPHIQYKNARYWASKHLDLSTVKVYSGRTGKPLKTKLRAKDRVPDDYLVPMPRPKNLWFPVSEIGANVVPVEWPVYCYFCNDWFDSENCGDHPCRHTSWCQKCGVWSTPGERCRHDKRKEA